ncbi:hypothetical protein V6N13_035214 [Hibiscus sabdariffa]
MERLCQAIHNYVHDGSWVRFKLSRGGSPISHLFFTDDLILYAKADLAHTDNIDNILSTSGYHSRHAVSKGKTKIFFSPNTDMDLQTIISNRLGFQRVDDMGMYLGSPVRNSGASNDRFNFIADKLRMKLDGWSAKHLSLTGRFTLAHSVLLDIPSYLMQTNMLPLQLCNDIERIVRRFIWGLYSKL